MQIKNHYLKKVLTWLLPFTCILCSQPSDCDQDLCTPCLKSLPLLTKGCDCCAIPLPENAQGWLCGQCLQKTPPFDVIHALYKYQLPITNLILELKFKQALVNAKILGELLAQEIQNVWYKNKPLPNLIIPMPLHRQRLKERGFNQALELARPVARKLKIPLNTIDCIRHQSTNPQATLSAHERQKNVKDAFSVAKSFAEEHIAVIDDVITTGSTMTEFCSVLKRQGAKRIDVWCSARVC